MILVYTLTIVEVRNLPDPLLVGAPPRPTSFANAAAGVASDSTDDLPGPVKASAEQWSCRRDFKPCEFGRPIGRPQKHLREGEEVWGGKVRLKGSG
jgi:hypothetical protein